MIGELALELDVSRGYVYLLLQGVAVEWEARGIVTPVMDDSGVGQIHPDAVIEVRDMVQA